MSPSTAIHSSSAESSDKMIDDINDKSAQSEEAQLNNVAQETVGASKTGDQAPKEGDTATEDAINNDSIQSGDKQFNNDLYVAHEKVGASNTDDQASKEGDTATEVKASGWRSLYSHFWSCVNEGIHDEHEPIENRRTVGVRFHAFLLLLVISTATFEYSWSANDSPIESITDIVKYDDLLLNKDVQHDFTEEEAMIINDVLSEYKGAQFYNAIWSRSPALHAKFIELDEQRLLRIQKLDVHASYFAAQLFGEAELMHADLLSGKDTEEETITKVVRMYKELSVKSKSEFEQEFPKTATVFAKAAKIVDN